jgi:hypothetical protein
VTALQFVYRLAITIWLGGMVVIGAVVAPALFRTLQAMSPTEGRALAGEAFEAVLGRFHLVAYVCGGIALTALVAMALLGPRPKHLAIRLAIVAGMLGLALYSGFVVLAEIDAIQQLVGTLPSRLSVGDARRLRFDELHVLATRLMSANIVAALALLGWDSVE